MLIEVPLTIHSDIDTVRLFEGAILRKITDKEIEKYFNIARREMDENLNVTKIKSLPYSPIRNFLDLSHMGGPNVVTYFSIASSNYIITINVSEPDKAIEIINTALQLKGFTKTRLGVYFSEDKSTHFLYCYPPCLLAKDYLSLYKKDLADFYDLLEKIKKDQKDPRFSITIEKYLFSISGNMASMENRFLDMVIALEILLLPKKNSELRYRFSLRGARLLNLFNKKDISKDFDFMKKIYDIRCDLAHEGKSKYLNMDLFFELQKIVSLFIREYLKDKNLFEEKKLDEICLLNK